MIEQLQNHGLVWISDVENDRFVPDWRRANASIRLRLRLILEHLHEMLAILQILSIYNVHLKFRVVADTHLCHELSFSLTGFLQLELNFVLLASMIAYVSHHFFLTLNQFVPSVQVFRDEFLPV